MKILARYRWWCAASFFLSFSLLAGCWPYTEPATGEYAAVLRRGEKVTKADIYGRFAALSVEYRQGGGSLMSGENHSMRLIHKDKIVVNATDGIERWSEFAQPVYFVRLSDDNSVLACHKNGARSWEVRPEGIAPGAAGARNAVEQLFISDQTGYRTCCAATNAACQSGWRTANAAELRKTFSKHGDAPPFAYVPSAPATAFGARVDLLLLSGSCCRVPSYLLYLDGAPAAVAAQLSARLRESKTPFVRIDECPHRVGYDGKCAAQLAQQIKRPESQGRELEQLLDTWGEQDGVLFVMPSMAVAVRANERGGSVIQTMLRADLSRKD